MQRLSQFFTPIICAGAASGQRTGVLLDQSGAYIYIVEKTDVASVGVPIRFCVGWTDVP
jgi:hypothetical protein